MLNAMGSDLGRQFGQSYAHIEHGRRFKRESSQVRSREILSAYRARLWSRPLLCTGIRKLSSLARTKRVFYYRTCIETRPSVDNSIFERNLGEVATRVLGWKTTAPAYGSAWQ